MAQTDYVPGKIAEPEVRQPGEYLRVVPTAASFGGTMAKGLEEAGQGVSHAGEFFGQVQTDDMATQSMQRMDAAVNKFRTLQGADRLNKQKEIEAEIEAAYQDGKKALLTPQQQYQYDNVTRNFRVRNIAGQMSTLAAEAQHSYSTSVNTNGANFYLGRIAANPDSDQVFDEGSRGAAEFRRKQMHIQGMGETAANQAEAETIAEAWSTRSKAKAAMGDPATADKWAEDHRKELSVIESKTGLTYYDMLKRELKAPVDQQISHQVGQEAISRASTGAPPTAVAAGPVANIPASYVGAIKGIEGFDPTPKWDVHQWTVGYGTRASGPDERPDRATLEGRFNREIGNAASIVDRVNPNLDPGTRAALTSLTFNTGDQWTRSGLGDAVRAGNLTQARELFLKYSNVAGEYNPTIAERRQQEAGWFGGTEAPPGPPASTASHYRTLKSSAYQIAMDDPRVANNPARLEASLRMISQAYTASQIAAEEDERAEKRAAEEGAADYTRQIIMAGATPEMMAQITADPRFKRRPDILKSLYDFGQSKGGLADTASFGAKYPDLYNRIFADGPDKITDINTILKEGAPGGGLTPRGVDELTKIYNEAHKPKKDYDMMAIQAAKASLMKAAERQMSYDQEMVTPGAPLLRDEKGFVAYHNKFVPRIEQEFSKLMNEGKNPWEYLTEKNFTEIAQSIRNKNDMARDRMNSIAGMDAGAGGGPLPPAPAGIDSTAWNAAMEARPTTTDGKPWPYASWAGLIQKYQTANAGDREEILRDFNKIAPNINLRAIADSIYAGRTAGVGVTPEQISARPGPRAIMPEQIAQPIPGPPPVVPVKPVPPHYTVPREQALEAAKAMPPPPAPPTPVIPPTWETQLEQATEAERVAAEAERVRRQSPEVVERERKEQERKEQELARRRHPYPTPR